MRIKMIVSSLICLSALACSETDADKYNKGPRDMSSDQGPALDAGPDMRSRPDLKDSTQDLDAAPDQSSEMSGLDMDMTLNTPKCGDGVQDEGEQCDDGALNSSTEPDACRLNCQTARCGDGVQDTGEQCDEGALNSQRADSCRLDCRTAFCGDSIVDTGEQCDDGNMINDDACTNSCTTCGNGKIDPGESCDDGGLPGTADDGCSLVCQVEPLWTCTSASPSVCWPRWSPDVQTSRGERYGATILVEGDLAVIGMPGEDTQGQDAGAVFIYERQQGQWRYVHRALPIAGAAGARFGSALSTFDGGLLIGAPEHAGPTGQAKAGAVYFLSKTAGSWANVPSPIYAGASRAGEYFGAALAGPYAGAPSRGDLTKPGSIYEMKSRAGAVSANPVTIPGLPRGSQFGSSLAQLANGVVVGAPYFDSSANPTPLTASGATFLVRFNAVTGQADATLHAQGGPRSLFGSVLSWTGTALAVGAPSADAGAGSITIFDQQLANPQTLSAPRRVRDSGFGAVFAGSGQVLWVGMPGAEEVYKAQERQGQWSYSFMPMMSREPQANSLYGAALATDGQSLWVGAPLFDLPNAPDLGVVFIQ